MEEETQSPSKNLKETLADVAKKLDELTEQKKVKKWMLPWGARIGMGKRKKRKGFVVFMNVGTNKAVTFIKAPVEENVAIVNGVPHVVDPKDILLWKNKIPIVIQPQWSEKPFSAEQNYKYARENGETTEGWEYIVNYLMKTQIKPKTNAPTGLIIFGVIALIGLGWYLIKSGALS